MTSLRQPWLPCSTVLPRRGGTWTWMTFAPASLASKWWMVSSGVNWHCWQHSLYECWVFDKVCMFVNWKWGLWWWIYGSRRLLVLWFCFFTAKYKAKARGASIALSRDEVRVSSFLVSISQWVVTLMRVRASCGVQTAVKYCQGAYALCSTCNQCIIIMEICLLVYHPSEDISPNHIALVGSKGWL